MSKGESEDEYLERCYFCNGEWGECTCNFPDIDEVGDLDVAMRDGAMFDTGSEIITSPNVSICTRFYVDPVKYYGEPYISFAKRRGLKPYGASGTDDGDDVDLEICADCEKSTAVGTPDPHVCGESK